MNSLNLVLFYPLLVLAAVPAAVIFVYLLVRAAAYGWHRGRFAAEERNRIDRKDRNQRNGRHKEETSNEC